MPSSKGSVQREASGFDEGFTTFFNGVALFKPGLLVPGSEVFMCSSYSTGTYMSSVNTTASFLVLNL